MKKSRGINTTTILVFIGLWISAASAIAQDNPSPQFGIKAGANFSNLYVSDVQSENMKLGINAGLFARFPLGRVVAIQPEVLYSNKGSKEKYSNTANGSGEYRFNLNYIETPLLLVFNITRCVSINAGGYAAYLLTANVKDMKNDGSIAGVQNLNADSFRRWDYGLVGGLGFQFGPIQIGGRYNYGLQNVGLPGTLTGELTKNSKNSVATAFIAFSL